MNDREANTLITGQGVRVISDVNSLCPLQPFPDQVGHVVNTFRSHSGKLRSVQVVMHHDGETYICANPKAHLELVHSDHRRPDTYVVDKSAVYCYRQKLIHKTPTVHVQNPCTGPHDPVFRQQHVHTYVTRCEVCGEEA
jgi:hypothetical protein